VVEEDNSLVEKRLEAMGQKAVMPVLQDDRFIL